MYNPVFICCVGFLVVIAFSLVEGFAQELHDIDILYLRIKANETPTSSNPYPIPDDIGVKGAEVGIADNNTNRKFMGYAFDLEISTHKEDAIDTAINTLKASTAKYVLLDMTATQQQFVLDTVKEPERLYFNVRSYDDKIRNMSCRQNLFHSLPSYAMRADALMQFVFKKQWNDIILVVGSNEEDKKFANALRRSAKKLGLDFSYDRTWIFDAGISRKASDEIPLFTRQFGDYDVMIVADERNDFARFILYNSWLPRPVLGADGLRTLNWSHLLKRWGAAQLQKRFEKYAHREMMDVDYAAWVSLRAIDEALLRSKIASLEGIKNYLINDLELVGYKGQRLSFRKWNGQLRQPIILTHDSALVSLAPLEGFLHEKNNLDSLGIDESESQCEAFAG